MCAVEDVALSVLEFKESACNVFGPSEFSVSEIVSEANKLSPVASVSLADFVRAIESVPSNALSPLLSYFAGGGFPLGKDVSESNFDRSVVTKLDTSNLQKTFAWLKQTKQIEAMKV